MTEMDKLIAQVRILLEMVSPAIILFFGLAASLESR